MKANLVAIGDEIVSGLTIDSNSAFLAQLVRSAGVDVTGIRAVADEEEAILVALRAGLQEAQLVITTGGLGPTADDLTTACVARITQRPLELHDPSLQAIERRFRERGVNMPPNNRKQAMLPRGCLVLPNSDGTAPGFICEAPTSGRFIASLPGVPHEMRRMAEEALLPWVVAQSSGGIIGSRVFSTSGVSESRLDELLSGVITPGEGRLSFRAAFPRMQARVTVVDASEADVERRLDELEERIRARLGSHLYAIGDEGLEETLGRMLRERGLSIAVAESCTGGLIGHRLTEVPGSSSYFPLAVVVYSNAVKESILGVQKATLEGHGAVSEATVLEMARSVRRLGGTTFGLATSGIAGPGGGTAEKPVGTVWIALAWQNGEWARMHSFGGRSRSWVKQMTTQTALDGLRTTILELFS
jgi:nicotinamide-nucleotide amidase